MEHASQFDKQAHELIERHQWATLRQACESAELAAANESSVHPHYTFQLFSYLLCDDISRSKPICADPCDPWWAWGDFYFLDLIQYYDFPYLKLTQKSNSARFLWKRIPAKIKKESAELQHVWAVGKAIWKNSHVDVYQTLLSTHWPAALKPLADALLNSFRSKTALLIARSYSNISDKTASELLGFAPTEAHAYCKDSLQWPFDENEKLFHPKITAKADVHSISAEQLNTLTSYVVHLERK